MKKTGTVLALGAMLGLAIFVAMAEPAAADDNSNTVCYLGEISNNGQAYTGGWLLCCNDKIEENPEAIPTCRSGGYYVIIPPIPPNYGLP